MGVRVLLVFGTRPEAVKMAPVIHALQRDGEMTPLVVVTGQHREMLDQVLRVFGIEPQADLALLRHGQSLTEITVGVLQGVVKAIGELEPDVVLVQGDTTTTFAASLASYYRRVNVVHLEAGLRTGDRWSPYPEEVNRRLTTQLASLHLAPTICAKENLLAEGVAEDTVVVTGNTVIDALLWTKEHWREVSDPVVVQLERHKGPVLLVTAHRRESWGRALRGVGLALSDIARARPDVLIVVPMHRNPVVREGLLPPLSGLRNVIVTEPLDYVPFVQAMARATIVLTDSGGIQEEAPSLGRPVLVMRDTTERPEGVEAGTARLVGASRSGVRDATLQLLADEELYASMARAVNPYGDGRAAFRAVEAVRQFMEGL